MATKIVLGLQFGDEGKGMTTDYHCTPTERGSILVVRFSGGHQAGHTVVNGDVRHVFSSYGSGTLQGCDSFISEHCTVYLPFLMNERTSLILKGYPFDENGNQELLIHPKTMLTLPHDIAYNRAVETLRRKIGIGHGTVGLGVGATMHRHATSPHKTYAINLLHKEIFKEKIKAVADYYADKMSKEFPVAGAMEVYTKFLSELYEDFYEAMEKVIEKGKSLDPVFSYSQYDELAEYENVVFEGSQGILLDMDYGVFPHVTYGHTTCRNALQICRRAGLVPSDVIYATRCYQTRHGIGWMSNEEKPTLVENSLETNVHNVWQEDLRVAELDYDLLKYAICCNAIELGSLVDRVNSELMVTCLDQRPDFEFDYRRLEGLNISSFRESRSDDGRAVTLVDKKLVPKY